MTDRPAALAKVAKLLPSLSRENDNEIVATVRAIGRALEGAGLDFHELARLIAPKPATPPREPIRPRPSAPGDPFRGASPFTPKPRRGDAADAFRYATAGAFAGGSAFVSWPVSKTLVDELRPRAHELSSSDRIWFAAVATKIDRGEMLSKTNHALLLDLVNSFRRQS